MPKIAIKTMEPFKGGNDNITKWNDSSKMSSKKYICHFCGAISGSNIGYFASSKYGGNNIYICTNCSRPTYFNEEDKQYPGALEHNRVKHINDDKIEALYDEARMCYSVQAYTSAALCCRKLLMNICVGLGAEEGKRFAFYVNWLVENGHIPEKNKDWLDKIRETGNEATHEICLLEKDDADRTIKFTEMLLKLLYEFPEELK